MRNLGVKKKQNQLIEVQGQSRGYTGTDLPVYEGSYTQTFSFDTIGNMTEKVSTARNSTIKPPGDNLNYHLQYEYLPGTHKASRIGNMYYSYDGNGNLVTEQYGSPAAVTASTAQVTEEGGIYSTDYGFALTNRSAQENGTVYRRDYVWNERNLLHRSTDSQYRVEYRYGADGQRAVKYAVTGNQHHETRYFNTMYSVSQIGTQEIESKHIYVGEVRIVTKQKASNNPNYGEEYRKQYYYHGDHLGSAQLVTDWEGKVYEHLEYTPYGELWVDHAVSAVSSNPTMFRFTGKELDQETGLYYYGARYLDPKTSRWISADPAMGEYVPSPGQRKSRLPGLGGIYNIVNMHVYAYTHNNPINLTDPDGKFPIDMHAEMVIIAFGGMIISTVAMDLLKMGASSVADIGYINIASVHMDNMTGTSSIKTFYLDTKNDFETFMENGNYIMAGVTLHTIADFYSHSNYISLYKQYAEQNGLPMDINKIPTFLEALQNSDLMKFIEDNGGLKTGTFRFWNPWSSNLESHNKMNLDKNKGKGAEIYNRDDRSTMHDAARATAQKDLNKIVQDWYNK